MNSSERPRIILQPSDHFFAKYPEVHGFIAEKMAKANEQDLERQHQALQEQYQELKSILPDAIQKVLPLQLLDIPVEFTLPEKAWTEQTNALLGRLFNLVEISHQADQAQAAK